MALKTRRARLATLVTWVMLGCLSMVTGCSSPPPTASPTQGGADGENPAQAALDNIYAQLQNLDAEDRLAKLAELADAEDGEFAVYTSMARDESEPLLEMFEETYGIEPSLVRSNGQALVQRILQETSADYTGADVVASNAPEMAILEKEGVLAKLQPTEVYGIPESYLESDTFLPVYLNIFTPGWNTDLAASGAAPSTWEEVLEYQGGTSLEAGDWAFYGGLVTEYFVQRRGMSQDEAAALFKQAAAKAPVVDGHTLQAQLLSAGEFPMAASLYVHSVRREAANDAPITWEPAVEPLLFTAQGAGVHGAADRPATSLLFIEWLQTEKVQNALGELGRTPAMPEAVGGIGDVEAIAVPSEVYGADAQHWMDAYEKVITGQEVRSE